MKHHRLIAFAAALTVFVPAPLASKEFATVGDWQIDESNDPDVCMLMQSFDDTTLSLVMSIDPSNPTTMILMDPDWQSIRNDGRYQLEVELPRNFKVEATGWSKGEQEHGVAFDMDEGMLKAFFKADRMRVSYRGKALGTFTLTGVDRLVRPMGECLGDLKANEPDQEEDGDKPTTI